MLRSEGFDPSQEPNLVPLDANVQGPFRWSKWPGFFLLWHGICKFEKVTLYSEKGVHAVIEPGTTFYDPTPIGYNIRTCDVEFHIMENRLMEKKSGSTVARWFQDRVEFADGYSFLIKSHYFLSSPRRYEFMDQLGRKQFRMDRRRMIWPESGSQWMYLMALIVIQRYMDDIYNSRIL